MLDPNPIQAPAALQAAVQKFADVFGLPTLPLHAHEVLFALGMYTFIANVVSPIISTRLFPDIYPKFSKRTKISWDVHVVSFVQSCVINSLSLYVIFFDEERKTWRSADNWEKRIWGYDGMSGLLQSQALGYFLWDLYMCSRYVHIFGWGMLAHAVSAVTVFSFGFRPFLYYYAPVFLLYELSSPFLNIHWFCDKLNLTGSVYQAVNGAFLTTTFFCCRILWGNYSSVLVFNDVYKAINQGYTTPKYLVDKMTEFPHHGDLDHPLGQTTAFMETRYLPLWLGASYLASNIVLNLLNLFWFSKMVQTIRTRFPPPFGTMGTGREVHHSHPADTPVPVQPIKKQGSVRAAREKAEEIMGKNPEQAPAADGYGGEPLIQRSLYDDGHKGVEVSGSAATQRATRSRRRG